MQKKLKNNLSITTEVLFHCNRNILSFNILNIKINKNIFCFILYLFPLNQKEPLKVKKNN